ncbi:MAG: hypothetical protein ACJ8C4_01180 [Gemmataceae bacterium]
MSITRRESLAAAVVCGLTMVGTVGAGDKLPAPDETAIKAVIAYFEKHDVKLQKDKGNWWVVVDPKGEGYEVIIAFRTFPAQATEQEMRDELKTINLGFMLNVPARVAMSKPGLRAADVEKMSSLDKVPVAAKLEKLFKEYRPPEPKK